ncbi:MAG: methyltransferase domain-containing protein [Candidatus Woesearchaeota archaeon]|jgi:SAM-dependent methyltransferase|nr:methyltransferase domain-containing protein [Candidatus Woesearchaeota archaeon]
MNKILKKINYYLNSTYRRRQIDVILNKNKSVFKGVVLDIGGRDRGQFVKPKSKVDKWLFADIEDKFSPDLVLDVSNMKNVKSNSIDIILAGELFEHVQEIEKGISECYRVLKKGGKLLITIPFLYPIHADPWDYQRWTNEKWKLELNKLGFKMKKFEVTGYYFLVLSDMLKSFFKILPWGVRHLFLLISFPFLELVYFFDRTKFVRDNRKLNKYHSGYFIIVEK